MSEGQGTGGCLSAPEPHRPTPPAGAPAPLSAPLAVRRTSETRLYPKPPSSPPPSFSLQWRFFWRVGPRPAPGATSYPELNAPPVTPEAFPEWADVYDGCDPPLSFTTIYILFLCGVRCNARGLSRVG